MSEFIVQLPVPEQTQIHHTVNLGNNSVTWPFTTILEGTDVGADCVIGAGVFIGRHVTIGHHTRIHPHANIPDAAWIGNYVFIGANVTLENVVYPHLRDKTQEVSQAPVIHDDAIIGSNAVIQAGVIVGAGAVVGSGSVVTRDVRPGVTVVGNPARPLPQAQGARRLVLMNEEGALTDA